MKRNNDIQDNIRRHKRNARRWAPFATVLDTPKGFKKRENRKVNKLRKLIEEAVDE